MNHKRVGRVMRKYGIAGLRLRKRQVTTVPEPSAAPVPDLFRRDFTGTAPNTKFGARCAKTAATSSWCQNRLRPSVCATAGKPLSGLLLQSLIRGLLVPNSDTICAVSTSRSAGEI
ncbi:hypothetical protein ACIQB5_32525 [Streptomyces sp. NPDC088560]|uniref:hypothetical protein n=1 Tax=Streptomyces sp. NPDC088560 TaxID=3365868 RepID=UPI00380BEF10